jgi:hypothetical protein
MAYERRKIKVFWESKRQTKRKMPPGVDMFSLTTKSYSLQCENASITPY